MFSFFFYILLLKFYLHNLYLSSPMLQCLSGRSYYLWLFEWKREEMRFQMPLILVKGFWVLYFVIKVEVACHARTCHYEIGISVVTNWL